MRSHLSYLHAIVSLAGLALAASAVRADIVIASGDFDCDPAWRMPSCFLNIGTNCIAPLPAAPDKVVIRSHYHAEVNALYNGWEIERYDTWAHASLLGVGTATLVYSKTCDSEFPERCTEVDLGLASEENSGSLLETGVGATAAFTSQANPILYPLVEAAYVNWSRLDVDLGQCQPRKLGVMDTSAVIAAYEQKTEGVQCCNTVYDVTHSVTAIASGLTVSSHNVRMTRCATGTGATTLDIDIDTNTGLCTDFVLNPPAGPWPRFGWHGRVIYRVYTPAGVLQMEGYDYAMFVGGRWGASARGGRLAGSFGAALDAIIDVPLADTDGDPVIASGSLTLSDPTVSAYLQSLSANTTVDVTIDVAMGSFAQSGDNDGDGVTNWNDRSAHAVAWGATYADALYKPELDWNADGVIDAADYYGLDEAWLANAPCPADCGSQGGVAGSDGILDNNDWTVFIDHTFNAYPDADIGKQGGVPGADGVFDNNDWAVFIDWYYSGPCN
ncbi:MAG: GC-type dockerin domain-anchored protein [Phycisphaerales bacterium]|nr:GC-type dockerin domain-anchored protein [Phycisphaerales bacterium]